MPNDILSMTREQWIERYAARVVGCTLWPAESALDAAVVAWEMAQFLGDNPTDESPEDAADEEMSYWSDDDAE